MATLNRNQMERLARLGALRRLEELRAEEASIRAAFPDLFRRGPGRPARASTAGDAGAAPARRRRPRMSAAQRRAVSLRMKKYWADRRKAKNG